MESDFFEAGSPEIGINGFNLTRLTESVMDIQLNFTEPSKLAFSASAPDTIRIVFLKAAMFMDVTDLLQLDPDFEI